MEQRAYDPRREERRKATRLAVPEDVDARLLDPEARRELRSLTRESADLVARHLVMTGRLLDADPEGALAHARAARAMAGRVGVVREAAGLAAYAAGKWSEGLAELRAARRITGRPEHLAVLADCERALGRPERALAYADDPAVRELPQDQRVELVIVVSGARRDLGQADAAVLTLQDPARRTTASRPWAARLWYAYADALLAAGRAEDARSWFEKAAGLDTAGQTDAGDRLLELDGIVLEDLDEDWSDEPGMADEQLAAVVAEAFPQPAPLRPGAQAPVTAVPDGHVPDGDDGDDEDQDPGGWASGVGRPAFVQADNAGTGREQGTAPAPTAATAPDAPRRPAPPSGAGSLMPLFAGPPETGDETEQ